MTGRMTGRTTMHSAGPGEKPTVRFLGTRGVPASHGGFETAAERIGLHLVAEGWRVVVYCQTEGRGPVTTDVWRGIERVLVPVDQEGWLATAVFDLRATRHAAAHRDLCVTFGYNTAALNLMQRVRGVPNIFNMDGIEWQRGRWGRGQKAAFRVNERVACRLGDHLIADHPVIEEHLLRFAPAERITMIAYGAPEIRDAPERPLEQLGLLPGRFSTVVCRPVAENSLVEIVEAFSRRRRDHTLVVLGDFTSDDSYHVRVREAAGSEVLFPGAIYDAEVMASLRYHSCSYVHGHTVGGTNPSLVEALGAGNPVIAHDNPYNRWVAGAGGVYFRGVDDLAEIFDALLDDEVRLARMSGASRDRHAAEFTWAQVAGRYEDLLRRHLPSPGRVSRARRRPRDV